MLAVDAVSGLGAAELRPGRVGRRRRRRRLAEGADVPARPRVRERLAARARRRRREAAAAATTSTGARPPRASARTRRTAPSRRPSRCSPALDVALEMIEDEGLENVCERHALLAPRHARRRAGARPRALRRPRRARERRHRDRAAGLDRRRQGPEDPARQLRHHRQRRPGAAQGQDRAHRPLRLLRRLRHPHVARRASRWRSRSSAHEVELGAGVGAAQQVFLEAGVAAPRRDARVSERPRILVKEKIADAGVELLREHFDVDLGVDWTRRAARASGIGDYDGILIRSATKLTAELIEPRRQAARDRPRRRRRRQRRRRRRRPSAASSSPTRRSRTSSPPPSTRSR